jgi:hypothetical protein
MDLDIVQSKKANKSLLIEFGERADARPPHRESSNVPDSLRSPGMVPIF